MTSIDSLRDFFFNIIPGIVFLLLFNYPDIHSFETSSIAFLLTFGFVLGFILDGLYTILRKSIHLDEIILNNLSVNDNFLFNKSIDRIKRKLKFPKIEKYEYIYCMDHLTTFSFHVNYACTRASFWGNLTIAMLLLSLWNLINLQFINVIIFLFPSIPAYLMLKRFRERFFSSVINAFSMNELYRCK